MYGPPAGMDCRRPVFLQAARTKNNATVAGCHRAKTEGMSFNAHIELDRQGCGGQTP
jgi:hypothetical protein